MTDAATLSPSKANRNLRVTPITPAIGAEIDGVDLGNLDDGVFEEVHRIFLEHQVVFFRDQDITPSQQRAFAERFGILHIHPAAPKVADEPAAMTIHTHKDSKVNNGDRWHTDVSCDAEPPLATVLHLNKIPPVGGDTFFASMYAAYDALSEPMRQFLSGLIAVHDGEGPLRGRYDDLGVDDDGVEYPCHEHPVIRTHPETGRPGIFVNRTFTSHIKDMNAKESAALLDFLYDHIESLAFQVRFKWTENAVALWDNRCVQHMALWDYWPHERKGLRYTVKGDRPFYKAG